MLLDTVTPDHIAEVVSRSTGVPVSRLVDSEVKKLLKLEEALSAAVVAQDGAVRSIANCVRLSRAGLHAHKRPQGAITM